MAAPELEVRGAALEAELAQVPVPAKLAPEHQHDGFEDRRHCLD